MLIIDAGPIIAAASAHDRHHSECAELLRSAPGPLIVPALVVTEVVYFLAARFGTDAERAFLGSLTSGSILVEPVAAAEWQRIDELVDTYRDLPLGTVDASVVALCERLGQTTVASLDHRHLSFVRPSHCNHLTLIP